jgi:hypothetical protein
VTTNAVGRASVTGLTPTGSGALQISASAAYQGQKAAVTIAQTNFATATQAAQAAGGRASPGPSGAGSSGGSGGLSAGVIAGVGAAAAAGTIVALKTIGKSPSSPSPSEDPNAPILSGLTYSGCGLQSATTLRFSTTSGRFGSKPGTRLVAEFGDGTSVTLKDVTDPPEYVVTHVYDLTGTFTVRLTVINSAQQSSWREVTVTIKNMTGRWQLGSLPGSFYDLTQTGATIMGTGMFGSLGPLAVSGRVQTTSPTVTFTDVQGRTFAGDVADNQCNSLNGLFGTVPSTPADLTRL